MASAPGHTGLADRITAQLEAGCVLVALTMADQAGGGELLRQVAEQGWEMMPGRAAPGHIPPLEG